MCLSCHSQTSPTRTSAVFQRSWAAAQAGSMARTVARLSCSYDSHKRMHVIGAVPTSFWRST
jgi:hypothetical protein